MDRMVHVTETQLWIEWLAWWTRNYGYNGSRGEHVTMDRVVRVVDT